MTMNKDDIPNLKKDNLFFDFFSLYTKNILNDKQRELASGKDSRKLALR